MKKDLPKVFANKINKKLNNNNTYSITNKFEESTRDYNIDVNKKINDIFKSPRYIYRANVDIKLKDRTIKKKIIGKKNNNIITIDNELIPISDIINIDFE